MRCCFLICLLKFVGGKEQYGFGGLNRNKNVLVGFLLMTKEQVMNLGIEEKTVEKIAQISR